MSIRFLLLLFLATLIACNNKPKNTPKNWNQINQQLENVNQYLVKQDQDSIKSYIKLNKLQMQPTATGLWYQITENGNNIAPKIGSTVTFAYRVELLDGTLCYTSDKLGNKTVKLGFADIESGLLEGLQLMHKGGKAIFILPPHLAHGLVGDDDKIPARAIIIYYVKLLDVQQ